jgi:hypothetical protein
MFDCKKHFNFFGQSTEAQPLSELRGRASIRSRAEALAQFDVVATSSTGYYLSLKHKKSNNLRNRLKNGSFSILPYFFSKILNYYSLFVIIICINNVLMWGSVFYVRYFR